MSKKIRFSGFILEMLTYAVTVQVGIRFAINAAATSAFDLPISGLLKTRRKLFSLSTNLFRFVFT
jgi:hypothetical protein